ncbi:PREDICTED: uncharacterized protein LOC104719693 [Camelina sativa]|uniref:Uncharacterized protein LOC104719693 n=1 Tax=Camelina sativa TaxID=90675 RepID=A0ABM0U547_CAMSA|nr:PREDICTED: uncharacterized protein LOC104719693 [Camelina sativa]
MNIFTRDLIRRIVASILLPLFLFHFLPDVTCQLESESADRNRKTNFSTELIIAIVLLVTFISLSTVACCLHKTFYSAEIEAAGHELLHSRARRGIEKDVIIESFPSFFYSEVKGLKIGKGGVECAICLSEFEDQETLRWMPPCSHTFHANCIDVWLSSRSTCPVCREDLSLKPGETFPYPSIDVETGNAQRGVQEPPGERSFTEIVKDYHKDDISPRSAVKIDISKAFDSVQWSFILSIFKALDFPSQFIKWIELCITTASFSVQVNGELSGLFKSARGLRQGCSLSPYLFVTCMQVLSALLDKAAKDKQIGYHPKCHNLQLTHLCFADDLLVFTDGTKTSIEGILTIFDKFADYSGLKISLEKSTLYMAGVKEDDQADILSSFPFANGSLPVRYLGLPLLTKRMTTQDYAPLIARIKDRISCWSARHLSFAGRLQLIASVLHSLINFWMSAFRLPNACISEIDSLCSAFLWSGPTLNTKKAKVAWKDVCIPREEGGLGLRSLKEANMVSCLKLIWRLLSAKSLWSQWLKTYLIRKGSFWSIKANTASGSWMWRKLLKYRHIALDFIKYEVRSGQGVSFWHDKWSALGCLLDITGPRGCIDMGIPLDATVAEALHHRKRRHRVDYLNQIEQALDEIRSLGTTSAADIVLWKGKGGRFTTKFTTRETWLQLRECHDKKDWVTGIWFSQATPKYSFIAWLATLNRLSTGDRMQSWGGNYTTSCALCSCSLETRNHLFFSCPFSIEIWTGLTSNLLLNSFSTSWDQLLSLLTDDTLTPVTLYLLRYTFQATVHTIWKERNSRRQGEAPTPAPLLIKLLDRNVRDRLLSIYTQGKGKYTAAMEQWLASR